MHPRLIKVFIPPTRVGLLAHGHEQAVDKQTFNQYFTVPMDGTRIELGNGSSIQVCGESITRGIIDAKEVRDPQQLHVALGAYNGLELPHGGRALILPQQHVLNHEAKAVQDSIRCTVAITESEPTHAGDAIVVANYPLEVRCVHF